MVSNDNASGSRTPRWCVHAKGVKEARRDVIRGQKSVKSLQAWKQRIPAISGEMLKPFGAQRQPTPLGQQHLDRRNLILRRLGQRREQRDEGRMEPDQFNVQLQ